jgi:hypothetical protein
VSEPHTIAPFRGYFETAILPVKPGQTVTIPKRTMVYSFLPGRPSRPNPRARKVVVHHLGCGQSMTVGSVDKDGTRHYHGYSDRDTYYLSEKWRVAHKTIQAEIEKRAVVVPDRTYGARLVIHLQDPTVVWAGSGGYWCWADLNEVLGIK